MFGGVNPKLLIGSVYSRVIAKYPKQSASQNGAGSAIRSNLV